jgi:hypothetical protein
MPAMVTRDDTVDESCACVLDVDTTVVLIDA